MVGGSHSGVSRCQLPVIAHSLQQPGSASLRSAQTCRSVFVQVAFIEARPEHSSCHPRVPEGGGRRRERRDGRCRLRGPTTARGAFGGTSPRSTTSDTDAHFRPASLAGGGRGAEDVGVSDGERAMFEAKSCSSQRGLVDLRRDLVLQADSSCAWVACCATFCRGMQCAEAQNIRGNFMLP